MDDGDRWPTLEERAALRSSVLAFEARTPRELASRARFLEELDRLARPFDREADPVHVTASAVVVGARGTVLHRHKRLGAWLQPGGHIEPGETPPEAAVREALEETGLPVRHLEDGPCLLHLDVHPAGPALAHLHLDLRYLLWSEDVEPCPQPGESPAARWFSLPEARHLADEALVDALDRLPPGGSLGDAGPCPA